MKRFGNDSVFWFLGDTWYHWLWLVVLRSQWLLPGLSNCSRQVLLNCISLLLKLIKFNLSKDINKIRHEISTWILIKISLPNTFSFVMQSGRQIPDLLLFCLWFPLLSISVEHQWPLCPLMQVKYSFPSHLNGKTHLLFFASPLSVVMHSF